MREARGALFAPPGAPAQAAPSIPPEPVAQAPAPPPPGRQVQGNVMVVWETCALLGGQEANGGCLLRCPRCRDTVFSACDIRL